MQVVGILATRNISWVTSDKESLSDDNYIILNIPDVKSNNGYSMAHTNKCTSIHGGWKVQDEKMEIFAEKLKQYITRQDTNISPYTFMNLIRTACDKTFKTIRIRNDKRKPVYRWSAEIANIRKERQLKRRHFTRKNKLHVTEEEKNYARDQYKEERSELKKAIKKAKKSAERS